MGSARGVGEPRRTRAKMIRLRDTGHIDSVLQDSFIGRVVICISLTHSNSTHTNMRTIICSCFSRLLFDAMRAQGPERNKKSKTRPSARQKTVCKSLTHCSSSGQCENGLDEHCRATMCNMMEQWGSGVRTNCSKQKKPTAAKTSTQTIES